MFKKSLISKKSNKQLIEEAIQAQGLNSFFSLISDSSEHSKLIFLHRFDLFGIEDEMKLAYFHLCDLPKTIEKDTEEKESKALQQVVATEIEVINDGKMFLHNFFAIDDVEWESFSNDLKDIIVYFLILFIRKNKNIKDLINSKDFNYEIMRKVLKDYKETINLEEFGSELTSGIIGNEKTIDPVISSKTRKIMIKFVSSIATNIEKITENMPKAIPNIFLSFHLSSRIWLSNLLKRSELTYEQYMDILDDLYRNKLIDNKSTIFWCENCNLEDTCYLQYHGRIAPSKISKNKCLKCNKFQSYGSIFSLNDVLKECILSKNGLISIYFGWLLKKENIEFDVENFSGEYENDFIIKKSILVECKMFKSEKDIIAIRSEMDNSFSQIKKHLNQLILDGFEINKTYLLWNRKNKQEDLQDKLKPKYKELFEEYNLQIICPNEIQNLLQKIK